MLENYLKIVVFSFSIMAFSTNFCNIETDMSGYTVWPQALYSFKESPNLTIFGIFNELKMFT